jgi:antagonist of KipI
MPAFTCETDLLIAYSGGGAELTANQIEWAAGKPIFLPMGTVVSLNTSNKGVRTYLAVAGGWDLPSVLNSRSTYTPASFGGLNGRALKMHDVLDSCNTLSPTSAAIFNQLKGTRIMCTRWGVPNHFIPQKQNTIRVVPGPEFSWFDAQSIITLLSEPFRIDLKSNRMGIYLQGAALTKMNSAELLSTAVCPGTIQVNGNGKMILLMADCQTTGGYPRIVQVATVDIPLCAQLKPGDYICFNEISRQEAENLYYEQERDLIKMAQAIQTKL